MASRVTLELVLKELRRCHFAVLSTVDKEGISHSAGVNYGVSRPGDELAIYVMTRRHLQKARDIALNPNVSLVILVPRLLLFFLPPATIQLRGRAQILDETDKVGTDVFSQFWIGRRILDAYEQSRRRGETRICFLKITPDPVIRTYMVGYNIWEIKRRMESGAGKVVIRPEQFHSDALSRG
jgi:general stress protein 26